MAGIRGKTETEHGKRGIGDVSCVHVVSSACKHLDRLLVGTQTDSSYTQLVKFGPYEKNAPHLVSSTVYGACHKCSATFDVREVFVENPG